MNLQLLKDEILNDPANLGYATHVSMGNHTDIANILNDNSFTLGYIPIESKALLLWAAKTGCHYKLLVASTSHPSETIKSICVSSLKILDRDSTTLNLNEPGMLEMVNALVAGTVFTEADKTSLLEYASIPYSRAQELWGFNTIVGHVDVAMALSLE